MKKNMKARLSLLLVIAIVLSRFGPAWASDSSKRVKVLVDCVTDDIVGARVCSQLKEKIRGSNGFDLVQAADKFVFCVHLVSIDIDQGRGTAISRTFSLGTDQNRAAYMRQMFQLPPDIRKESEFPARAELLLEMTVLTVGALQVPGAADALFAEIDQYTEFLRR
jgi:hypothetical protein